VFQEAICTGRHVNIEVNFRRRQSVLHLEDGKIFLDSSSRCPVEGRKMFLFPAGLWEDVPVSCWMMGRCSCFLLDDGKMFLFPSG
jgi:hypothetical protein